DATIPQSANRRSARITPQGPRLPAEPHEGMRTQATGERFAVQPPPQDGGDSGMEAPVRGAGGEGSGLAADILNVVDDAFFVLDRDWRLVYVTRSLCELLGRPREELLGRPLPSVMPRLEHSNAHRTITEALEGRGGVALDAWEPPGGEPRWREMTVSVFGE